MQVDDGQCAGVSSAQAATSHQAMASAQTVTCARPLTVAAGCCMYAWYVQCANWLFVQCRLAVTCAQACCDERASVSSMINVQAGVDQSEGWLWLVCKHDAVMSTRA